MIGHYAVSFETTAQIAKLMRYRKLLVTPLVKMGIGGHGNGTVHCQISPSQSAGIAIKTSF